MWDQAFLRVLGFVTGVQINLNSEDEQLSELTAKVIEEVTPSVFLVPAYNEWKNLTHIVLFIARVDCRLPTVC